jgi:hypothetical protein
VDIAYGKDSSHLGFRWRASRPEALLLFFLDVNLTHRVTTPEAGSA